jgi:hypothetical protein
VLAAFAELRERPSARLRRTPALRVEDAPIIRGNVVALEPHLVMPPLGAPLRYLRNVDLLAVLTVGTEADDVGEMYARYTRRCGPVPLPDFLGALSVLIAKGAAVIA